MALLKRWITATEVFASRATFRRLSTANMADPEEYWLELVYPRRAIPLPDDELSDFLSEYG